MRHNPMDTDLRENQEKASLMHRPGFNNSSLAKTVPIGINSHRVVKMPTRKIYQYDVSSNASSDHVDGSIASKPLRSLRISRSLGLQDFREL